jgi:DNA-directed RNA polymerase subunit H
LAAFEPKKHSLVPQHSKLTEAEKKQLFEKYNISIKELPKISKKDAGIEKLNVKEGDIIRIERESPTAGKTVYYRGVVHG